jgi:hypothetical protein
MRQGEAVLAVHAESGICLGTLYRWKHQALVDAGLAVGMPSTRPPDLQSAAKRVRQLEDELAIGVHHSRDRDGATVMHSDHGTNFTSGGFSENLRQWELTASLGLFWILVAWSRPILRGDLFPAAPRRTGNGLPAVPVSDRPNHAHLRRARKGGIR